jgi:hypothetical protein
VIFRSRGRRLHVYRRGVVGWGVIGCFAVFALVGLDGLLLDPTTGGKWFGVVFAAVSVAYTYVLWRVCSVVIYSRGALVGTLLGPRWIEWAEIEEVTLAKDRSGYGRPGQAPVIRLKSGRRVKLGAFFAPDGSKRDIALAIVSALNDVRSGDGSGDSGSVARGTAVRRGGI